VQMRPISGAGHTLNGEAPSLAAGRPSEKARPRRGDFKSLNPFWQALLESLRSASGRWAGRAAWQGYLGGVESLQFDSPTW
jgi:hypothetical protein